jgi:hypothetical protein
MESDQTTDISTTQRHNAGGAPRGNKNAVKHGLYAYKAMLNGNGLDERTSLFKALREKEQELVEAIGGDPSPQQRAIIGDTVKNLLYIASIDNHLMGLKSLVRKGRPHPLLAIRTQLAAHNRENYKTLGIHRRQKSRTLTEILADDNPVNDNDNAELRQ